MQWELVVVLVIAIPVILFPAAYVWYLNIGGIVEAARREKGSGARYLLVDMGGVVMITSAGLRALHDAMYLFTPRAEIDTYQKANPGDLYKSSYFKLAGATTNVYSILNLAGFLHNIPIFPDVKQALESFK